MGATGKQPAQRRGPGLRQTIEDYLQENEGREFTARELAVWFDGNNKELGIIKMEKSTQANSHAELIDVYVGEIAAYMYRNRKKSRGIEVTTDSPRKFYYSRGPDEIKPGKLTQDIGKIEPKRLTEADLYPVLQRFLYEELNILGVRIDENRSRNSQRRGGNRYLFPDLVGIEIPKSNWNKQIRQCAKHYHNNPKLSSFEVKLKINRSNCREYFNQTVLNSSWAHIGYLVVNEIGNKKETMKELEILSGLHGIGIISLTTQSQEESRILIHAREKPAIQWRSANRLAEENYDFERFIKSVNYFIEKGEHTGVLETEEKQMKGRSKK